MQEMNLSIHSVISDLLQTLVSRGDLDVPSLQYIQKTLCCRLLISISRNEPDLQNKFLHVLHPVIHGLGNLRRNTIGEKKAIGNIMDGIEISSPPTGTTSLAKGPHFPYPKSALHSVDQDQILLQILSDTFENQKDLALLHHWVDFFLMTINEFRKNLMGMIFPLIDHLVNRLNKCLMRIFDVYSSKSTLKTKDKGKGRERKEDVPTDAEFVVLMNALERLLLLAWEELKSSYSSIFEEAEAKGDKLGEGKVGETTGLLGYVTGVLGSGEAEKGLEEEPMKVRFLERRSIVHIDNLEMER
jgi:hypothetical protein